MGMKDQFQQKSEQLREKAQERMGQGGQGRPEHRDRPERQGRPGGQNRPAGQERPERQRPGSAPQERARREMDERAHEGGERFDVEYDA
jgi:hypothetical protein